MSMTPPPRRARHLMDPTAPRQVSTGTPGMSITSVQRWVLTALVITTVEHFALAFVFGAKYIGADRLGAQGVLLALAGVVGVLGIVAALALHRQKLVSWWLPLGLVPAVAGAVWVL